jgi:hypothetical protein
MSLYAVLFRVKCTYSSVNEGALTLVFVRVIGQVANWTYLSTTIVLLA